MLTEKNLMLLLITDTSGRNGSIALARASDEVVVLESVPLAGGTFSAQLVPQIAGLLANQGFNKHDIDAFVVVAGPGSFTGLRVGLAAIKALAEILGKPIVAVSLLEAVAFASRAQGNVLAALDAGRGEVYAGQYEVAGESACMLPCSCQLTSVSKSIWSSCRYMMIRWRRVEFST